MASHSIKHANILLLGHSFTRRLREWCVKFQKHNLNLSSADFTVFMHGVSGACVLGTSGSKSLWYEVDLVSNLNIDFVILDVGSNDVSLPGSNPIAVAEAIYSFARQCINHGASGVICLEILPRLNKYMFNEKCKYTNTTLSQLCENSHDMYFWTHHRNHFNDRFLAEFVDTIDGVHIKDDRGMSHYYRSVRGAVIKCRSLFLTPVLR